MLIERFPSRGRDRVVQAGEMPSYFSPGRYRVAVILDEESGKIRALNLRPEGVDPEIAGMEADEFRLLRWIRFDPPSREKLPPLYQAFPEAGIALVYDGPAYKSYEEQQKIGVPRIRPSTWRWLELGRSQNDSDAFETVFYPVAEFVRFATDVQRLDSEQANVSYLYARLFFREAMMFSAFHRIEFVPHLFFYDYARRIIEARGQSPDAAEAWDEIWTDLPVPAHPFFVERGRSSGEVRIEAQNASVFFFMTVTPRPVNVDAIGMVRTDAHGTIREFFVASLLNSAVDFEKVFEFVCRLPGNENCEPVLLDEIIPLVSDAKSGTYALPFDIGALER